MTKQVLLLTLMLSGCASLSQVPSGSRPADFRMTVFVDTISERNAQYVVAPDRVLRAAIGRDVTAQLHPPATATLTPTQMDRLWQLVQPMLTQPPDAPTSIDKDIVHLMITADGHTYRWQTTPDAAHVQPLLNELTALRGG